MEQNDSMPGPMFLDKGVFIYVIFADYNAITIL
jgi:hypothetical protein